MAEKLLKIFHIKSTDAYEDERCLNCFKQLSSGKVTIFFCKQILQNLIKNKDDDQINDYFKKKIQKQLYNQSNFNDFIKNLNNDLENAIQIQKRIQNLDSFISFLSELEDIRYNDEIKYFLEKINDLKSDNCKIKNIKRMPDMINDFLYFDKAITMISNVFYRFLIKQKYIRYKIDSFNSLKSTIEKINNGSKYKMNINFIKKMNIQDFDIEIIQKTQQLMKNEKLYHLIDVYNSNLIYQRIESNFLKFDILSDESKIFLHTSVIRVIHSNDFAILSKFFNVYFHFDKTNTEKIKFLTSKFKEDDNAIREFKQFSLVNAHNMTLNEFIKNNGINWPSFDSMGIEIRQVSQFFAFWKCIIKLIYHFQYNELNESILIQKMSEFLYDKNKYMQFQIKIRQTYIEPAFQNIIVLFGYIMRMLNASNIANSDSTFQIVSKNAAKYLEENPIEFSLISKGIEDLLQKEYIFNDLFSTNVVIKKYEYIKNVFENDSLWEITTVNGIRLLKKDNHNCIISNFEKLKLIAEKLDNTMIKTVSFSNINQFQLSKNFVEYMNFNIAKKFYDKICILHKLIFDFSDKVFLYESFKPNQISRTTNHLDKIIFIINTKISELYKGSLCIFTKEQYFKLYKIINQYFLENKKSQDLVSIFEGTLISNYLDNSKTSLDDYYMLIKDKFEPIVFDDIFDDKNAKKIEGSITKFSQILTKMIDELILNRKVFDDFSIKLETTGNLKEYLASKTIRCINLNTISKPNCNDKYTTAKYQLHSMILYLFKLYKPSNNSLPFPTQLLICSKDLTISQIDSFLGYFNSTIDKGEKLMFIVISPIQLQPTSYDYLMAKLNEINETVISQSRIVILYEKDDLEKNDAFNNFIANYDVGEFVPIFNKESLKNLYKIQNIKTSHYGIQTFFIYNKHPRSGKTHMILQHIFEKYPDHVYSRITIDEFTTLTTIINFLNNASKVDEKNKAIIFHFNVDLKCSTNFHLYIQNLAFFRSLNNGIDLPFLANNHMAFYFEFSSSLSFDKEYFIQNIFPIAEYMDEIKIPDELDDFFTYDEFQLIPHDTIKGSLKIIKQEKFKQYLIEAAVFAFLDQDKDSILNIKKSALFFNISDFIGLYKLIYNELKNNPKKAYYYLLNMIKPKIDVTSDFKVSLISQINDVSKIIAKFKGILLSILVHATVKFSARRLLVGLAIETSITNCGIPYIPYYNADGKINYSEELQERVNKFNEFITKRHILAICDPNGDFNEQIFTLICNDQNDFDKLLKKYNYHEMDLDKNDYVKDAVKSSFNVISDWNTNQNKPDELLKIIGNILNLDKYDTKNFNIAMLIKIWNSFDDYSLDIIKTEWKENIDNIKKNTNLNEGNYFLRDNYSCIRKNVDFERRRNFWNILINLLKFDQSEENNQIFDIVIKENTHCKNIKIFVSNNINNFITNCEEYILNENPLLHKYSLTGQNITLINHIVYRILSNIPIILIGETGSGKKCTFSFISKIIGPKVKTIKLSINQYTNKDDLQILFRSHFDNIIHERSKIIKEKLREIKKDITLHIAIIDSIKELLIYQENNEIITDFEYIKKKISLYIDTLSIHDLSIYNVVSEEERKRFKDYVLYNLYQIYTRIEKELDLILFYIDGIDNAKCQSFFKDIIIDRYFDGKKIPEYIRFVCSAHPLRKVNKIFDPIYYENTAKNRKEIAYDTVHMPELFIPYMFPVDINREYGSLSTYCEKKSEKEYLFDINNNSEFDAIIDQKTKIDFSLITPQFFKIEMNDGTSNLYDKISNANHFSLTDRFSSSFDYSFFNSKLGDTKKSMSYHHAISFIISRIITFCCRLLYHKIYKDKSFISIRDPERCIQIMRWAYKFGIIEELSSDLNFNQLIKRMRKAFIIGLSVSFWLPLPDIKHENTNETTRNIFIKNVCEFWQKILNECDEVNIVKNEFNAPNLVEWTNMIEEECKGYYDIFIDDDESIPKNKSFRESIWASYICIMNNINLWIISKSDTLESLAVNIMIKKLIVGDSTSEKIIKCPPIEIQTFTCANESNEDEIYYQLDNLIKEGNINNNCIIKIIILKGIENAKGSTFKPLLSLENLIDNGYNVIGFSRDMIESLKLNRGVFLLH